MISILFYNTWLMGLEKACSFSLQPGGERAALVICRVDMSLSVKAKSTTSVIVMMNCTLEIARFSKTSEHRIYSYKRLYKIYLDLVVLYIYKDKIIRHEDEYE